ncbi:hypothetical protein niasHT_040159 [Heterodera trifolii]|uniref:CCHC-type domain-containing protein n=1 Tax=Heterodera trifolii TaxID=157864 RepID=A0ABD2ICU9_9BILA
MQQEENVQKELPAKSKSKNAQKNEGRSPSKHFAVEAKVITIGGSQPMQIGYVINRKGMMYDVHFQDGYTGRFHTNNLEEYLPAKDNGTTTECSGIAANNREAAGANYAIFGDAPKRRNQTASQSAQQFPVLPDMEQFEMGEQHSNIEDWIDRFNFAIDCAAPTLPDELKVKLLMTKLAGVAYSEYSKSCLPKKVAEFTFAQTMEKLKVKHDGEEFGMFINRQKRLLRDFNFKKLNEEQFNCLVLLLSLKEPNESILRSRILAKLAADGDQIKYDNVVEDLKVYLSTISEAKTLEQPPTTTKNIFAVKKGNKKREGSSSSSSVKSASSYGNLAQRGCWRCGVSHFPKKCNHLKTTCRKCNKTGHLERMCAKHQAWLKKNDDRIKDEKATNCVRIGALMLENGTQQKKLIEAPIGVNGMQNSLLEGKSRKDNFLFLRTNPKICLEPT